MSDRGKATVLIGFMGAGKSAAGRVLAERSGLPLRETDELVSARTGRTITQLFAEEGEAAFRDAESAVIHALAAEPAIVVTGGGAILRPENVACFRRLGQVVHLTADPEILFGRVSGETTRPLLLGENSRATFARLFAERAPLYAAAADWTIDTAGLTPEEVAEEILRHE